MDKKYLLSENEHKGFQNIIKFKHLFLHYNSVTVNSSISKNASILLIGNAINCLETDMPIQDICDKLSSFTTLKEALNYSKYLLGRFTIIRFDLSNTISIIPDATCTVPVNYYQNKNGYWISSSASIISELNDIPLSEESIEIKNNAENQHPLPYNITMFEDVKTLIPNHYLDLATLKMIRYYPNQSIKQNSFEFVLDETIRIMDEVVERVVADQKVSIPITSGVDSRTILALFKDHIKNIPLYTFYNEDDLDNWDIKVPKVLAEKFGLDHLKLKRKQLSDEEILKVSEGMDYQENNRIISNASTLSESEIADHSFISGDIIPIAKSNFGKNLPEFMATSKYFTTKSHNYSAKNKTYINHWMKDAENNFNVSKYDLFFWEHRFGRWFTKNSNNYDLYSDPLYIFNCRYLIELWISVSRKERLENSLHKEIIKRKWPELLEVPINPGKKTINKIFSNQYAYYLGSFLKYYLKKK